MQVVTKLLDAKADPNRPDVVRAVPHVSYCSLSCWPNVYPSLIVCIIFLVILPFLFV